MIFLLEYDRPLGRLVTFREFSDSERLQAENARLELEVTLNRSETDHEVVLLQAENKLALQQTHRRYFAGLHELITGVGDLPGDFRTT